ncbi:sensor histidine kinase [Rhodoplanes sp. Z2-YC6860]|uniref:sensor histidine kinase n=1 Tax=Rhodoplanes sp. Z2-YC6860 TaxID=674703 RepID=UPI0008364798|nr:HAMP domain-containing sensor histidine kinase [Rhodoplanes sp. Z2-YC6860]
MDHRLTSETPARWMTRVRTIAFGTLVLVAALMAGVFVFDILTPPDDVSICFIYAVLIPLAIFSFHRAAYACAALATSLSVLGAFFQPPHDQLPLVFFTNRAIAIVAQWLVAFLVTSRQELEAKIRSEYEAERTKADTSRRFVDMLTHEIGTSLTLIDGQAYRLKKLAASDDEGVTTRAEKIHSAVKHIDVVIRQVQAASEAAQASDQFEPGDVNLASLIGDLVVQLKGDREIQTDIGSLPPVVRGNSDMLQQVVANILSNALKYSPEHTAISVWGRAEADSAILSITDRGRGIPPAEKSSLFEPYYRASNSRGVPGTGIGLYVVRRYVSAHGGAIEIESDLDVGTTLTVRLPIGD